MGNVKSFLYLQKIRWMQFQSVVCVYTNPTTENEKAKYVEGMNIED